MACSTKAELWGKEENANDRFDPEQTFRGT